MYLIWNGTAFIAPPTSIPRYRIQFFGLSNKSTTCWIQGISAILTADPNKRIFSYFDAISCGIFIILLKPIHNFIDISVKISSWNFLNWIKSEKYSNYFDLCIYFFLNLLNGDFPSKSIFFFQIIGPIAMPKPIQLVADLFCWNV